MYIEQLYTNCLAEAAYYIESEGEAAIIDPMRDIEPYLKIAEQRGTKIKYVFETHFHADFVSGHIDLARKTGAEIIYGPHAKPNFQATIATDNQKFQLGKLSLKVLHTPGHTEESSCFLLSDEEGNLHSIFTGDTLFVGDVGRPDLAVKSNLTKEDLAAMLYESINNKIKTLPDSLIVYPAHGAGSSCGKNIGKETTSTIGIQKKTNYALQEMSKIDFIKAVTDGLTEPPKYFFVDAMINKTGYESIDKVMDENTNPLTLAEFVTEMEKGALVLDVRFPDEFEKAHIPNSINIGLNGQFAMWVGALLDVKTPILLLVEDGKESEAILRLARVGYENVKGFLKGGIQIWKDAGKETASVKSISATEFAANLKTDDHVLDVRNSGEFSSGVLPQSELIPLGLLEQELAKLNPSEHFYIHCAGGYRSMIASSLLKRKGFHNLTNIYGGMDKIKKTTVQLVIPQQV